MGLGVRVAEGIGVWVAVGGTGAIVGVKLGVRLGVRGAVGGMGVEVGEGLSVGAGMDAGWHPVNKTVKRAIAYNKHVRELCPRTYLFWVLTNGFRLKLKP